MKRTGLITAFATRSSLWLGKDHLLCIDSTGYAEEYKRFYFRDIQAITLVTTKRRLIWNWVLGVPLAGCVGAWGIDLATPQDISLGGIITGVVFTLLFAVPMLLNNLYGPSCACHLHTAVQTEALPSLNRVRRARKVLGRIGPLIEAVQGARLSPEAIASALANPAVSGAPPVIAGYNPTRTDVPPHHYPGTAHLILFWLLLADVPLTAVSTVYESTWMDVAGVLFMLVSLGYAIASLIKQRNTTLPAGLKLLPWLVLGWAALMLAAAMVYGVVLAINNPEALESSNSAVENPAILTMTIISTAGTATMGIVGLVRLRRFRAASPAPAVETSEADPDAA